MIAIYQLFKIILGIVISVFVLTFLIFFSGTYAGLQENTIKSAVVKNFRDVTEAVYFSGNPINFSEFAKREYDIRFDSITPPSGITFETEDAITKIPIRVPVLFAPGEFSFGEEYLVSRSSVRLGSSDSTPSPSVAWWEFNFVEATPGMVIIFNPVGPASQETRDLIKKTVLLFQDTFFFKPDVNFTVCNGLTVDDPETRNAFIRNRIDGITGGGACTAEITSNQRLVRIDSSCDTTSSTDDVCIKPTSGGVGQVFLKNSGSEKVYMKDYPLSLVALIIGGDTQNIEGVAGEILYNHANNVFLREMELATKVLSIKSDLISTRIGEIEAERTGSGGGFEFPPGSDVLECKDRHSEFSNLMETLNLHVKNIIGTEGYNDLNEMGDLVNEINSAGEKQRELIDFGCDYRID